MTRARDPGRYSTLTEEQFRRSHGAHVGEHLRYRSEDDIERAAEALIRSWRSSIERR